MISNFFSLRARGILFALVMILLTRTSQGQVTPEQRDVTCQMDAEVWSPLVKAAMGWNAAAFIEVHAQDFVHVATSTGVLTSRSRFETSIHEGFPRGKARGLKRDVEVRFTQRSVAEGVARTLGVYKSVVTRPDGSARTSFTGFDALLKLEAGRWKLWVDQDRVLDDVIGRETFESASPVCS